MRCIRRVTQHASRSDVFRLIVLADPHLGNLHSDERTLKRIVADIAADEHAYWIGLGDYCEFINIKDPRFDPGELVGWLLGRAALKDLARAESRRFLEIVEPIAPRCLALCEGNHEAAILQHSEVDVYSVLLEGIAQGDPDHDHRLDHRGMVSWVFERTPGKQRWALHIYATHGSGGGRTQGAVSNRLAELAAQVDGIDIILQGHSHKPQHVPQEKFRYRKNETEQVCIHTVSTPGLCRDMRYAESKDMKAVPIGFCQFTIVPETHAIAFSMDVR